MNTPNFWKTFGPGILFASTAIGVSHLVQSTRAGAIYGFALLWAILAANIFKYPFFEFGTRYANATGKSIIDGYKQMGRPMLWGYFIITLSSMFFVCSAVGAVTSGFFDQLFSIRSILGENSTVWTSLVLFSGSVLILYLGKYKVLDRLIKLIGAVLILSTIVAFVLVLFHKPVDVEVYSSVAEFPMRSDDLVFIIALMGWMPTAVDLSAWNSLWTLERIKSSAYQPSLKASLLDFNFGYWASALLSICFLVMGAKLLYGREQELPKAMHLFASGVVSLYTQVIGSWSHLIIGTAACSIMFGTCIAVFDGYSRAVERCIVLLFGDNTPNTASPRRKNFPYYRISLLTLLVVSLSIVLFAKKQLLTLVDIATTISFLIAPLVAIANYRLVTNSNFPTAARPKAWLRILSVLGIVFLSVFCFVFIYIKLK